MVRMAAVVLAAGQGKRMLSDRPKVLHPLAGMSMINYVLKAVQEAGIEKQVVVVGHQSEPIRQTLGEGYIFAYQDPPLGTGDAVLQAEASLPETVEVVMVVCGDTPLLRGGTLRSLMELHLAEEALATVLTAICPHPAGYGRIIRGGAGEVVAIVEERDAGPEELLIKEINTGIYCFQRKALFEALHAVGKANAQGEYYLPDVLAILSRQGGKVVALEGAFQETRGVNSRSDLAAAAAVLRGRINQSLMAGGVTMVDPAFTYVDAAVVVGRDTVLYPGTILEGDTVIGENCEIGPFTTVRDSRIGNDTVINRSVVLQSEAGNGCQIGPFAYLRPGTRLASRVKVGDFVEIKKSEIDEGSKVPHLTYLGDTSVGKKVNVGAGTITCNYDGEHKWPTFIEDEAFIGSNANLVAPVRVGRRAVVGAGSTITRDVPPDALGVARNQQSNIVGWSLKKGRKLARKVEKKDGGR